MLLWWVHFKRSWKHLKTMNKTNDFYVFVSFWHFEMSNLRMPKMQRTQRLATFFVGDQQREHDVFPMSSLLAQDVFPWRVCMSGSKGNIKLDQIGTLHWNSLNSLLGRSSYDPCLFLTGDCFFQLNWKLVAGPVHVSSQGLHCCASVVLQATKHPKSEWHPLAARKGTHHYFENTLFWFHHFKRSRLYVPLGLKYNENVCAIENSLVCEAYNDEWQPPSWTIYVCFSHAHFDPFETWHCIAVVTLTSQAINMRERYPGMRTKRCCEEPTESSCLACCPSAQASAIRIGKRMQWIIAIDLQII